MKHFILLAAAALASIPSIIAQEPVTLDLDRCIAIALTESPTVRIADMEVARVDYSRKEIIGQLLPNIDLADSITARLQNRPCI